MSTAGRGPGADPAESVACEEALQRLAALRSEMEGIDRTMVHLISERVRIAKRIGEAKRRAGLPTLDGAREAAVVRRAGALAREAELDDEDVRSLFWNLIGISRRAQLEET